MAWWVPFAKIADGAWIAFNSERDGNSEIYVMRADGSMQTRLTQNDVYDERPDWSPDGQQILFSRGQVGGTALWVMSLNGRDAKQISPDGYSIGRAHWSGDGLHVVSGYRPGRD